MSSSPKTPQKRTSKFNSKLISVPESNSKTNLKNRQQCPRNFISWYKQIIDNEREKLGSYLSDDVILKWFGRTIRSRKKVYSFFRDHVEYSKHYLTSVESISKLQMRQNRSPRKSDSNPISPSYSPEVQLMQQRHGKRRLLRSSCSSPQWAPGCKPDDEFDGTDTKRSKLGNIECLDFEHNLIQNSNEMHSSEFQINNKGDFVKRPKHDPVTPPNIECGQGDCLPSTSSDSNRSHETLNAQLPKLAVECNGYIEFTRTRNNKADRMKWERKCKLQVHYSEDPLNVGEFIIWMVCYSDESKCKRNLLAEFDDVPKEEV